MNKPSIPKGTRDFGPVEMQRRNYIFDTIKSVYDLYGFMPIETPAMENLSTLTGKYGEEGDKLLFKILNSGDYLGKLTEQERLNGSSKELASKISEKGLRYDLTVPFARFVVMHRNELTFPFKRYQIQPVWRADRPQKGRYREFYQCDADTVGTDSLLPEVEFACIINEVFSRFDIRTTLHINNRKILAGIAEVIGAPEKLVDLTIAIDKLDKVDFSVVEEELRNRGFESDAVEQLRVILNLTGSNTDKLNHLREVLTSSETGLKGIEELCFVLEHIPYETFTTEVLFNPSLARGLDYYTGAILEVKANDVAIGSIAGGGRYDNLTGVFGLDNMSGVGISFGADRIYDVLLGLDKYPNVSQKKRKVLFVNFGLDEVGVLFPVVQQLRSREVSVEIYPESARIKKQMSYADSLQFTDVVLAGSEELKNNSVAVKNMQTGEQKTMTIQQLLEFLAPQN
ncbi:MAG: histidine--tRNA ligase [Porphyromonas sp.]|nr:histidine--tRNA ligase [Porphyromonas sp.]